MAAHIDTGTMVTPRYHRQTLAHLGLVAGMYDELEIGTQIDHLIAQDADKRQVSLGQAVKAMVLNGLGFVNQRLYLVPYFFADKPTHRLLGPGISPEHLNDDVLGRALDQLYAYGVTSLYLVLAPHAVRRLGLTVTSVHADITSFHVDGQYNSTAGAAPGVVHITPGYSRDHRPDLNQVALELIVERQAGLPLLMQPLNGNAEDKTTLRTTVQAYLEQLQTTYRPEYVVADSALYTAQTLPALTGAYWITRVPATLKEAHQLLRQLDPATLPALDEQTRYQTFSTSYAGIPQRWVVVYSDAARQRAQHTVRRQCLKASETELQAFTALCQQAFACEADARHALAALQHRLTLTTVEDAAVVAVPHSHRRGRPKAGQPPDHFSYHLTGQLASRPDEYTTRLNHHSGFILATNQLDRTALPERELLQTYKAQQQAERGFRFLKDPLFLASSLYLKSPQRIMAVLFVMTLCLLVYAALEHRLREALKAHSHTCPDQKGRPTQRPTARWVFQYFVSIHLLVVDTQEWVLNLNEHHGTVLAVLGEPYQAFYS